MGHTKGPWRATIKQRTINHPIYSEGAVLIGTAANNLVSDDEAKANVRLMAASPDLLAALKGLIAVTTKPLPLPGEMDAAYAAARAAIARAEGTK